jgi:hypothetical protein
MTVPSHSTLRRLASRALHVLAVRLARPPAKPGRRYLLDRLEGDLSNPAGWQNVAATDRLTEGRDLMLADPQPPSAATVIYRVRVQED